MNQAISLLAVLAAASVVLAATLKPDELIKKASDHDGKPVVVTGTIEKLERKTSRAGNKYYTLQLKGEKESVNVYGRGELAEELKNGVKATASGIFRKEKKMRDFTVKNEVDVSKPSASSKEAELKEAKSFGLKKA